MIRAVALRPETLTAVLAIVLLGCGGHTRGNAPGGAPTATEPEPTAPEVTDAEDGTLIKVSLSDQSACALSRDGQVTCFDIARGFESASSPVAGKFRDVAGSASAGAALRDDGSVATWGDAPPRFLEGPFKHIAFDLESACGIKIDGSIACSGTSEATFLAGNFQQLQVAGNGGVCGLTTDGALQCKTTPTWRVEPPANSLPPLREFSVDPTGEMGGCGIDLAGALHCWGYYCSIPGVFAHVALSYFGACATTINGKLQCWNFRLALNDCTSNYSAINLPEPPTGTFTTLASWLLKSCAIEASGDGVQCW